MLFAVAAVDAASGEVDDHVRAVDLSQPRAGGFPIPDHGPPGPDALAPAENHDFVLVMEGAGEKGSEMS